MSDKPPFICKEIFKEVLQDEHFMNRETLSIFRVLYAAKNHKLSTTEISKALGWKNVMSVNTRIVALGKRMEKFYGFIPRMREDGSKSYWDFFFTGYYEGTLFIFTFLPQLKKALEECGMVDDVR